MRWPALLLLGLVSTSAQAAVPPQQITWVQPGVSPSRAQVLLYTLTITVEGNPVPQTVGLLNVLCGGPATAAECSVALPAEAQAAILSGNASTLRATAPETGLAGPPSAPFVGNQGCLFRDTLYGIGQRANAQTNKQGMTRLLDEFQAAKFEHVSTTNLKGNQFLVVEQCVGYLVPDRR